MLRRTAVTVAVLTSLLTVGCGRGETGTAMPSASEHSSDASITPSSPSSPSPPSGQVSGPPLSSTDLPTLKPPTAPPRTPSDLLPSNVIVGLVTIGGSGPCYGMQTDDGKQYALYSDTDTVLVRGSTVRVWFEPKTTTCSPGTSVRIVKVEIVR